METLNTESNFLAIENEYSNFEDSKIVIVSAPYEHTTSYGDGTSLGPNAIIEASAFVEFYDDEFDNELCFEKGIATLPPIDFQGKVDENALLLIENQVSELLNLDKFVVTLGGEHTISTAPIKAHYKKYPNMSILQFDAHSDLRDSYGGTKYSHASIMARVLEFFPPTKFTQVGIRAQCLKESILIRESGINTFYANKIRRKHWGDNWQKAIADTLTDDVYITFDVDYFDPSIMPATGTPEPNGFLWAETMDIFNEIRMSGKRIIGFDVVELAPMNELTHPNLTVARLAYKLLNYALA